MINYKNAILDTKAYKTIIKDKEANRLSHTYLLITEDKEYAKQFAQMLSEIMLNVEPFSREQSKIEKGIHPDVLCYGETDKITTQLANEIASDVYVRPYEGDNKVYVLFNMENMQDEAQNKLLKTIEEPPKSVFFILISSQEKKLLQTVLSRSKKIELDAFKQEVVAELLRGEKINEKEIEICSACSNGVVSRAYKLATDKEFLLTYENIFKCLYKMNSSRDVLDFTNIFQNKNVDKTEFAELFMLIVRDLMMVKAGRSELALNKHKINEMKVICEGFSMTALYKIMEYCLQLKEDLVYNTSIISSIDQFLLKVVEVKVRCKK